MAYTNMFYTSRSSPIERIMRREKGIHSGRPFFQIYNEKIKKLSRNKRSDLFRALMTPGPNVIKLFTAVIYEFS